MNKEIGLREFAIKVASDPKRDVVVNSTDLYVHESDSEDHIFDLSTRSGIIKGSEVTPFAADKLFQQIGSGFTTYGRELAKSGQVDLINQNLERRFNDMPATRFLVRGHGTDQSALTRSVLSDKYRIMDTDRVLNEIMPVLNENTSLRAIGGARSTTRDYMKYVERSPSFSIMDARGRNREFSVGFVFSNSEVGAGATMFELFLTDHYCENGCIFSSKNLAKARFTHRGAQLSSGINGLIDDEIDEVRDAAILGGIKKAALLAASKFGKAKIKELIEASMSQIDQNKQIIMEQVGSKLGIRESTMKQISSEFFDDGNKSPFGIQAAITSVAKKCNTIDERLELEHAGGAVLEYPASFWKSIEAME